MLKKLIPSGVKTSLRNLAQNIFGFEEYKHLYPKVYKQAYDDITRQYHQELLTKRAQEDAAIPSPVLEEKHIKNLQVLVDRQTLLHKLPKNAVCSELGVDKGDFTARILEITTPHKLHLIDAWGDPNRYHDGLKELVREKFTKEIAAGKVEMNIGFSTTVLNTIPDEYFDWVYLDTDHGYPVTAAELAILKNKVKRNGIIAGHDYIVGNWAGDCRYGVIEAVHELCVTDGWELIYITINKGEMPSFAIRRLS